MTWLYIEKGNLKPNLWSVTVCYITLKTLDFCVNQAVAKIFSTYDKDCINQIRLACDLPDVDVVVERRRMKFVNNILENEHLRWLAYLM